MLAQSVSPPAGPVSEAAEPWTGAEAEIASRFGNLALRAGIACIPIVVVIGFMTDRPVSSEPLQLSALKSTDSSGTGPSLVLPASIDLVSLRGSFAESIGRTAEAMPARINR